jgi:hypothetical protein
LTYFLFLLILSWNDSNNPQHHQQQQEQSIPTVMNIESSHHYHSSHQREIGQTLLESQTPDLTRCETTTTTITTSAQHHHSGMPSSSSLSSSPMMFGKFLPPLLTQRSEKGLAAIPQTTLCDNLTPVIKALEKLDAELLLDLHRCPEGQGPKVRDG